MRNSASQQELRDIWEWDGTSWQQSSVSGASNTIALGVAYDEKTAATYLYSRDRGRVVLYGGEVAAGTPDLADTWEFDGTSWTRQ